MKKHIVAAVFFASLFACGDDVVDDTTQQDIPILESGLYHTTVLITRSTHPNVFYGESMTEHWMIVDEGDRWALGADIDSTANALSGEIVDAKVVFKDEFYDSYDECYDSGTFTISLSPAEDNNRRFSGVLEQDLDLCVEYTDGTFGNQSFVIEADLRGKIDLLSP